MITTDTEPLTISWSSDLVNPLQRVIADSMAAVDLPLERRGSKAELSRRSGVSETIISYIFNREAYLPDERHRVALAKALRIPRADLDAAGAAIKGLRVHGGRGALTSLEDARADLVLSADGLSPADLRKAQRLLADLRRQIADRLNDPPNG